MKTGAGEGLVLKGSKSQGKFLAIFLFLLAVPAIIIAQNVTNLNESFPNSSENFPVEIPELPNQTLNETTSVTTIKGKAELELDLKVPDRVTRGEEIKLEATVSNPSNVLAKDVILSWKIPEGFEVISGDVEEECGTLEPGSSCSSSLMVKPSLSSKLGEKEIRVVVSYE